MQIPAKDVEFAAILKPLYEFALYYDQKNKIHYFIRIQDGKEIDRHPIADLNLDINIEMDKASFNPCAVLSTNGIELFRFGFDWAYDGCLLTQNSRRTAEEGIRDFEDSGCTVIRTETKIIIVLP